MKHLYLLLIVLLFIGGKHTLSAQFAGGDGSENNPYQIKNLVQLDSVHNYLDKDFVLMNDLDFAGSSYNSDEGWKPIGNNVDTSFTGSFNGQGYIIYGLYINRPSTDYIGLFGYTSGATIDSLGIVNCYVLGGGYVGGLVGYDYLSNVSFCYATGNVVGRVNNIGLLSGYNKSSQINCCYVAGTVSGNENIGGLSGYNDASSINNSYATSCVTVNSNNIGGLTGVNISSSSISNCYATGKVFGTKNCIGGLIGVNNSSSVTNCYYNRETSGQETGIGNGSGDVTDLTTAEMKQASNFSWNIGSSSIWKIIEGDTYPALESVSNNAPFAFADTLQKASVSFYSLLANDYDYETAQENLVLKLVDNNNYSISDNNIIFPDTITAGDTCIFSYCVGELLERGDTLWGNIAQAIVVKTLTGEGTATSPFQISTIAQLDSVHNYLDKHFILMNDLDFAGSDYQSGEGWEPIGDRYNSFTGSFNGQGHTISNLFINRSNHNYNIGAFGFTKGAEIDSLGIINCDITGPSCVGGLVGYNSSSSTISNCYSTGSVSSETSFNNSNVGGIVGENDSSFISNCYSNSRVVGNKNHVGGLVGYNSEGSIENCYSAGRVSGENDVGGLVGENEKASIENCYSAGRVSGENEVGGLVGWNNEGSIKNCYSTGSVSGESCVGSFVGETSDATVENCYATGGVTGNSIVGAFIGALPYSSTITNCYYNIQTTGQPTAIGYDKNSQTVKGLTTAQMKQADSFSGWDISSSSSWKITNAKTLPRLQDVYNYPVILTQIFKTKPNVLYTDTIRAIPMDNAISLISFGDDKPEGMIVQDDSITIWTPDSIGTYSFTIKAEDANGMVTSYLQTLNVIPFDGSGSESDPYQITTLEDLDYIRNLMDKHFVLMNDLDFAGSDYQSGEGWEPIGDYDDGSPFTGNFNGAGHAISNLYINSTDTYVGLFGWTYGTEIDSLSLPNCNITGDENIGGLIGVSMLSSVNNCYVTGVISGKNTIGGLIGGTMNSSVNNCYAVGCVAGDSIVGGLVAYNYYASSITNCYAVCRVKSVKNSGALVGKNRTGKSDEEEYESTISSSFYNSTIAQQTSGIGYDENGQEANITALSTTQMKQISSFSDWDIGDSGSSWNITNGETFPRLRAVYNNPILLSYLPNLMTINVLYADTIQVIPMDNEIVSITFDEDNPEKVEILQDSILACTPSVTGSFSFKIYIEDIKGRISKHVHTADVIPFEGGLGSEINPYQIATIEQLDSVRNYLDKCYILLNDLDFAGSDYQSGEGWESIGDNNSDNHFTGSFNGQGHIINNLYINRPNLYYVGMFGYTEGAEIDSLGIINCDITGLHHVGGLIAKCESSVIQDCYASGSITGSSNTKSYDIGGLIGMCYSPSLISNCFFRGSVSGGNRVGGLMAESSGSTAGAPSTISNCYASGSVSGEEAIGGLVASTNFTISNCYFTGSVSGVSNTIGGLIGWNNATTTISNCYAACSVEGGKGQTIGGLIGYNNATISNSFYNSTIAQQTSGIGYDANSQEANITALSTTQMKQKDSFSDWDIGDSASIWGIVEDHTYPVLESINNSPFVLDDYLEARDTLIITANALFDNDYDYETAPNNFVFKLIDNDSCIVTNSYVVLPETVKNGDTSIVAYRIGELLAVGDTLWGNTARIFIKKVIFEGKGTAESPYKIKDILQLNSVRKELDKYYILMNDLDFAGSRYDSINSTEGWDPIGHFSSNNKEPFTGSFNGQGHTISGLYINRPDESYVGLFAYLYEATIYDLGIVNCNISGNSYVGGLAGWSYASPNISNSLSEISDCYVMGNVYGKSYTGGFIGMQGKTTTTHCYATGNISGSGSYFGGLVGINYETSKIIECYATAGVSGTEDVGGLVGQNTNSNIQKCYAIGRVEGSENVGGLIGHKLEGTTIVNSYYDSQSSGQSIGIGSDDKVNIGYSTVEMKQKSTFKNWDINNNCTWHIVEGKTYPALNSVSNNAPFAFVDSIIIPAGVTVPLDSLLSNDYDYETQQTSLVAKVTDAGRCSLLGNNIVLPDDISVGEVFSLTYIVGELLTEGDTLWGNEIATYIINNGEIAPNLRTKTIDIDEDSVLFVSLNSFVKEKTEGKELTFFIIDSCKNGSSVLIGDSMCYTPDSNFYGYDSLKLTANDGELSDTEWEYFNVTPINDAPVLTDVSDTIIDEDSFIVLTMEMVIVSDVDNDEDELSFVVVNEKNYSVDGATVTPKADFNGELSVFVAITDGESTSDTLTMNVTINPVNDKPVICTTGSTVEDTALKMLLATDIDGDNPLCSILVDPINGEASTKNDSLVYIPNVNFYGKDSLQVIANDEICSDTAWCFISVSSVNDAPVIISTAVGVAVEDKEYTYTVTATDVDDHTLTYRLGDKPDGMEINGDSITWTPTEGILTSGEVVLIVSDGKLTATDTLEIAVIPINDAPFITSTAGNRATEDEEYVYTVIAEDPEDSTLTYALSNMPDSMKISDNIISWTPTEGIFTSGEVFLTVSDGELSSTDTFIVSVTSVNDAPVITSTAGTTAIEEEEYIYTVIAKDVEDSTLTYSLSNAPSGMEINDNCITWTPAEGVLFSGDVKLKVSDGELTTTETFTVTVTPVNDAPVITSTAGTSAIVNEKYTYTVTATDVDNKNLTYTLSNKPDGMKITNNVISWTPASSVTTSGEVTLTVSDGELNDTEKFTITVNPSSAVQELEIEDVIIYPNPVNNELNIQCSTKIEQIEVISLNGQVILTRKSNATEEQLDMQGLSQGTYLVKIITEQETLVRTILKKSF